MWEGYSPFQYTPSYMLHSIMENGSCYFQFLFEHMNSPEYYSVYPPVSQFIYFLGAITDDPLYAVVTIRLVLVVADIVTFHYLGKLLQYFNKPKHIAALYFLNPLVIIELTGNLHFEGLMICFLVISLYFLLTKSYGVSVIFYALSVGVKLLPLIFLPLIFFCIKGNWKWKYVGISFILIILQFSLFVDIQLIEKILTSVRLYFHAFEFNASLYYLLRMIGYHTSGYNMIQQIGTILVLVSLISIVVLSFVKRQHFIMSTLLIINVLYLCFSTTVHPWYIVMPFIFSLFTPYRFVLVWTFMVFMSYAAYQTSAYTENLYLVGVEYAVVSGWLAYEFFFRKREVY